ncbi:MAG: gliding motility-associated C-terminal domain-containing protein [Chitinophagaceae bacterium]|nr:gliding motility-associated C-terminal domain-containing protein [Chitinophagaceae bacterium]
MVLPTQVLGNEYVATSMNSNSTTGATSNGSAGGISEITVVATQPNTTIEITPSVSTTGRNAGVAYTVNMPNAGDVYQLQSAISGDLSGTKINSKSSNGSVCKPIAVFSGSTWATFDCTSAGGGDNLLQQLFPVGAWGKTFVTAPFINRPSDIFRIFVKNSTTTVQVQENGILTTLNSSSYNSTGKFYTYRSNNPIVITGSEPIQVAQYITSQSCKSGCPANNSAPTTCFADPEMVLLNPIEQTLPDITFFSAHESFVPANQTSIKLHFVNIIVSKNYKSTVKIDNAAPKSSFVDIPGTSYSYLQEDLTTSSATNPVHRVVADTNFAAIVYGYGPVESYGYNGGTNVKDFTPKPVFQNQFGRIDSAVTCINSPVKFSVPLSFVPTTIKWDFSDAPNITPNTTIQPSPIAADSTIIQNGLTINYYSPGGTYTFSQVTASSKDVIKLYTTSSTPDGCGNTEQLFSIPVTVRDAPVAAFQINHGGCVSDTLKLVNKSVSTGLTRWLWDFSDGTTADATVGDYSKVYTSAGTGTYDIKLKVISDIGCASPQVTQTLNLSSKPVAKFTPPATACMNQALVFKDASTIQTGTITRWTWSMDSGAAPINYAFPADAPATYTSFGPKDVWLVVSSGTGCMSDTFRLNPQFKVNASPEPGFIIPEVCLKDASAQFTDTTKIADGSTNFVYAWNFNAGSPAVSPGPDNSTSTLQNPAIHYNKAADYKVSLKVTSNGCSTTISKDFTVNGANPVSAFEVQKPTGLCSNDSVRIKNKSTVDFGTVTRLEIFWDANDPTKKTVDENPSIDKMYAYRYPDFQSPASQTYSVSLKAYSGNAASCAQTSSQTITVNASPKVSFVTMPGICFDAAARQITEASFDNRVSGTFVYSGTGVSPAGMFNAQTAGVGVFPIKYVYTSAKDCRDSATVSITVWPSPVAKWGVTAPLCQKNDIVFSDSSVANYSKITKRNWNYDDGSATVTRTDSLPYTRRFAAAKTYSISLQVITDSGCKSPLNTQAIRINYLPKPAFSLPSICLPDGNGQFNNQSSIDDGSEALFSYRWNFNDPNDPSASTLKDPVHRYSALGPYDVQLKVTSKDGCVDSLTQKLNTVYPQPKAAFTASPKEICVGDSIHFKDLGNGITSPAASWFWNLGDGSTSTSQNPVKKYADSGALTVSFYFLNGQGCVSDTAIQQMAVNPYPKLDLGPDLKVLEGGVVTIRPKFVYGTALVYKWTPASYLDSDTAATPRSTPADDITYQLQLTGKGGCSVTDAIFIQVLKAPEVPNAFSPNGDGVNDTWRIKYLESYPGAEIDVYDRFGQVVYHSVGYDVDWDGTYKGHPMPVGTYYYVINPKNNRKIITGSVTIIK